MATESETNQERDALWTYIGQDTWLLQIAPSRYFGSARPIVMERMAGLVCH